MSTFIALLMFIHQWGKFKFFLHDFIVVFRIFRGVRKLWAHAIIYSQTRLFTRNLLSGGCTLCDLWLLRYKTLKFPRTPLPRL